MRGLTLILLTITTPTFAAQRWTCTFEYDHTFTAIDGSSTGVLDGRDLSLIYQRTVRDISYLEPKTGLRITIWVPESEARLLFNWGSAVELHGACRNAVE